MTLFDLYQIKLYEYKKFGLRDEPYKLLAILLYFQKHQIFWDFLYQLL